VVDRAALEMRSTRKCTGGSNPSLSANDVGYLIDIILLNLQRRWLAPTFATTSARDGRKRPKGGRGLPNLSIPRPMPKGGTASGRVGHFGRIYHLRDVEYLKQPPELRDKFDRRFGAGSRGVQAGPMREGTGGMRLTTFLLLLILLILVWPVLLPLMGGLALLGAIGVDAGWSRPITR
jgi:hypothetical protein